MDHAWPRVYAGADVCGSGTLSLVVLKQVPWGVHDAELTDLTRDNAADVADGDGDADARCSFAIRCGVLQNQISLMSRRQVSCKAFTYG